MLCIPPLSAQNRQICRRNNRHNDDVDQHRRLLRIADDIRICTRIRLFRIRPTARRRLDRLPTDFIRRRNDARADGRSQSRLLRQTVRPLLLHAAAGRGIRVRIDGRDQRIRLRCRIVARSVRNQAVGPYRTLSQPSDVGLQLPVIFGNRCERGLFPARNQPDGRFQILFLGRKNPIPPYRNRTPRTRPRLRSAASRSTMPVTTSAASCQRLARKRRR